jgi:dihydropteroate synthase
MKIMGIVNVTPDSFSDGGAFLDPGEATRHGRRLINEGADILDIGGESTRPGAEAVEAPEEIARVVPVIEGLVGGGAAISIDTSKAAVAAAALAAGATIVNDVTALGDPEMAGLVADHGAGLALMHMLGSPRTMQQNPTYDDVVDDIKGFLAERIQRAVDAGVPEEKIWIDPGIGFGKTVDHNLELIRRLGEFRTLGRPILIGTSRKSFIGKLTGAEVNDRLGGTLATDVIAYANGAEVVRVHDVAPAREALITAGAILDPERAAAIGERPLRPLSPR